MVFKKLKRKLEKAKAKHHGMTVTQLREHQRKLKAEKKQRKLKLRAKERAEKQKFDEWKIEQKYKEKRKQVKSGKGKVLGALQEFESGLEVLGGKPQKTSLDDIGNDFFGSPPKKKRKRRKKR